MKTSTQIPTAHDRRSASFQEEIPSCVPPPNNGICCDWGRQRNLSCYRVPSDWGRNGWSSIRCPAQVDLYWPTLLQRGVYRGSNVARRKAGTLNGRAAPPPESAYKSRWCPVMVSYDATVRIPPIDLSTKLYFNQVETESFYKFIYMKIIIIIIIFMRLNRRA